MTANIKIIFRIWEILFWFIFIFSKFYFEKLKSILCGNFSNNKNLFGLHLVELIESLGPTAIKIGQILSFRYDIFPTHIIEKLSRLHNEVSFTKEKQIRKVVEESFKMHVDKIFEAFDPIPVASGSIAQVHRAIYKKTGEYVAVKIRRPGIINKVNIDIKIFSLLCNILSLIPSMKHFPLNELMKDIGVAIEKQLDLNFEKQNIRKFRYNFKNSSLVVFPIAIDELCTESVLTMEFIEDLIHIKEISLLKTEKQDAIKTGLRALFQMIFIDGLIHCDLHPGNIFFGKENSVIFVDLGFVVELTMDTKELFAEFFFSILDNDGQKTAEILEQRALYKEGDYNKSKFKEEIAYLVKKNSKISAGKFSVIDFVSELFILQKKHGLIGTPEFTMAIVALLFYEGIVKYYYSDLDFQNEAKPYLMNTLFQKEFR